MNQEEWDLKKKNAEPSGKLAAKFLVEWSPALKELADLIAWVVGAYTPQITGVYGDLVLEGNWNTTNISSN